MYQGMKKDKKEAEKCAKDEKEKVQAEEKAEVKDVTKEEEKKVETDWQAKFNELNDSHLRLMADFDNFRKRNIKEKADLIKNAGERIITDFLPIVDNFERALKSIENQEGGEAAAEGVKLIYNQIMTMLKENGVEVISTEGELNTDLHDAITTIPAPTPELKDKIVDCVKKGYTMNGKVIRHAQVVVGE